MATALRTENNHTVTQTVTTKSTHTASLLQLLQLKPAKYTLVT